MNKKLALCVGINRYKQSGNDLSGCVNDANHWTDFLHAKDYETVTLTDEEATREYVVAELGNAMHDLRFGDRFVFTYSGHGSWVPDTDGDEADQRDECLVLFDWNEAGFLTDDQMYRIFQQRRFGVRVSVFSDSCHSGTVARFLETTSISRARFFNPALLTPSLDPNDDTPRRRDVASRPGTMLMSGCDDLEYSYDAWIDGIPQGAFSATALKVYEEGMTMKAWHNAIRKVLGADVPTSHYNQTPQLQASAWQRTWRL